MMIDLSVTGAWRYWQRNTVVFRRIWLLGLMAWFLEPVIYLLAMGNGLGSYLGRLGGVSYIQFIGPGLLSVSAMYGASFEATWNAFFKKERTGVYQAATSTPLSAEDVALGEVFWSATRGLVYGSAFSVIAVLFGLYRSWWGLLVLPALALISILYAIMGLTFTYMLKRMDFIAYYWTLLITPMFMFSGIFFPLDRMPDWVRAVAWFSPLYHATTLMRSLMLYGDPASAAASAGWIAGAIALTIMIPVLILRRRLTH